MMKLHEKLLLLKKKGKLKVISKYGIGLDKIDLKSADEFGIKVCKTPGVNHVTVSVIKEFQEFLIKNKLSSHVWVLAKK